LISPSCQGEKLYKTCEGEEEEDGCFEISLILKAVSEIAGRKRFF